MKAIVFVVAGIALLIAAAIAGVGVIRFKGEALRADGRVVRLNAGGSHPEIAFTTAAGERIRYPQGGLIFGYRPGDRVRILYRAERPRASASVDTAGALWAGPLLLGVLGAGFVLGGASHRRRDQPPMA
ncbi:MAG: DUF3592 domain-containing protein [Sphingomonas sp.]